MHCGDPAALNLQDLLLNKLQKITDGVDVRVCQIISLVLDLGGFRVGQPDSSLFSLLLFF